MSGSKDKFAEKARNIFKPAKPQSMEDLFDDKGNETDNQKTVKTVLRETVNTENRETVKPLKQHTVNTENQFNGSHEEKEKSLLRQAVKPFNRKPVTDDDANKVRQELRIRKDLNEKLRIRHAISKKSMSSIMEEALEMYFKNQE